MIQEGDVTMKRFAIGFLVALAALVGTADEQMPMLGQTIHLKAGWNAFYLKLSPLGTADEVFAGWPVSEVGMYDAAAFTATRQFAAGLDTEGVVAPGMRVWRRGDPDASTLKSVKGNSVYTCYATGKYDVTLYGPPDAMRMSWHPVKDSTTVLNYAGVSLDPTASSGASVSAYFSGLDAGATYRKQIYGSNANEPQLQPFNATSVTDGSVLLMDAGVASDWSGVLYVTPASGVEFSTNRVLSSVSVRNDGATARQVRISLRVGDATNVQPALPLPTVMWRDPLTLDNWHASLSSEAAVRTLEPGQTWTLELALDRTQFQNVAVGTVYGGLLQFTDVTTGANASRFQTSIMLRAVSDGARTLRTDWPAGLWLCEATFDQVTHVVDDNTVVDVATSATGNPDETKAGGRMEIRLPVHVDVDGNLRLCQRVSIVAETNGVSKLYAGGATRPAGSIEQMRISSVVLPTDIPVVNGTGVFGNHAEFSFVVGERSKVNPFRHALHPNHDGLRSDFSTQAPSGDDVRNYMATVKPELFSISNAVELVWNENTGSKWTPAETLKGTCIWTFSGLRREADLRARGKFTMRRILKDPVLNR